MTTRQAVAEDLDLALGHDTLEDVAVVVARTSHGDLRAALLPRSVKALSTEDTLLVSDIQHRTVEIQQLAHQVGQLVEIARERGLSWSVIGWSTGLSSDAARKRWSDS